MSSWFDPAGIASLAKNALKEAQKTIDKALDIQDDDDDDVVSDEPKTTRQSSTMRTSQSNPVLSSSSSSSTTLPPARTPHASTPADKTSASIWDSFSAGTFFDSAAAAAAATNDPAVTRPPTAQHSQTASTNASHNATSPVVQPTVSQRPRTSLQSVESAGSSIELLTPATTPDRSVSLVQSVATNSETPSPAPATMSGSTSSSVGVLDANSPNSSAEMARTISSTPSELFDGTDEAGNGGADDAMALVQQLEIISDLRNDDDDDDADDGGGDDVAENADFDNVDDDDEEEEDSRSFNTVAEANVGATTARHQHLDRMAQLTQETAEAKALLAEAVAQHFDVGGSGQLSDSTQSFEYVVGAGSYNGSSDGCSGVMIADAKRAEEGGDIKDGVDGRFVKFVFLIE